MARFPSLEGKLEFANVYVDGEDVRTRDGYDTAVSAGDTVILLPAMAGGC
jgi:molybdopterin converting factor small subunit